MATEDKGRFSFDGAENIAFWIAGEDPELEHNTRVMFSELKDLQKFLGHNFPGLMSGITDIQVNRLAQYLYEGIQITPDIRLVMDMTSKATLVKVLTEALARADVAVIKEEE